MNPSRNPARMRIGIIGGGHRCLAIMALRGSDSHTNVQGEIVGVADRNPGAVGLLEARRILIFSKLIRLRSSSSRKEEMFQPRQRFGLLSPRTLIVPQASDR